MFLRRKVFGKQNKKQFLASCHTSSDEAVHSHVNQTGDHNCTEKSLSSLLYYFPKASHSKFIGTKPEIMRQHHISKAAKTAFKKHKNCKQLN